MVGVVSNEQVERTYSGTITIRSFGDDDDALYLDPTKGVYTEPLAGQVAEDVEEYGNTVTVSYWITDEPRTMDELVENDALQLAGSADADYHQRYSEITGYLYTDAELVIGGHDLLAELESHVGRWCLLRVRFGERPA